MLLLLLLLRLLRLLLLLVLFAVFFAPLLLPNNTRLRDEYVKMAAAAAVSAGAPTQEYTCPYSPGILGSRLITTNH